jgi:hypothetical protein
LRYLQTIKEDSEEDSIEAQLPQMDQKPATIQKRNWHSDQIIHRSYAERDDHTQ